MVVVLAQDEARALRHTHIGTEHILLGLLRVDVDLAARSLVELGVTLDETRRALKRIVGEGDEPSSQQLPYTRRAVHGLELALRESLSLGHDYIGTEHLLLGLMTLTDGRAAQIVGELGAAPEAVRAKVLSSLGD